MIGNDRQTDIAGAKAAGMATLYMHTALTPPEQAEAEPSLHPGKTPGPHYEYEGWDWEELAGLICSL
jgi:ribonucleotide monophosphatase NagD (HAD superfamily)